MAREAVLQQPGDGALGEGRALQVGRLLEHPGPGREARRQHEPAEAQRRREDLREAPGVDDPLGVERAQGGQPVPVVAQQPVGVVLDDGDAEPARQRDEPPALLAAEADAARVVGVGHRVDERGPRPPGQQRPGAVDVHAGAGVGADGQEGRPVRQQRLAQAGVDVLLGEHVGPRRHQQLGGEAQRLLGAGRQQHLPGVAVDAPLAHQLDDALAERLVRRAVLHRGGVVGQDVGEGPGVGGARYQLGGGEAPGERHEAGPRRQQGELAETRAGHSGRRRGGGASGAIEGGDRHVLTIATLSGIIQLQKSMNDVY